jgi:NRAMP (natural resistance-associated macrophage protein)-like metal ion transporter
MKDTIKKKRPVWLSKFIFLLTILGPGLITASADNDAPGIATYSVAGATYGYKLIWIILVITIGEVVILEMAARMGAVTGKGTADLIRERFGVKISTLAMLLLIIANIATTIAQFAGVAAAGELFGISRYISVPIAAVVMTFIVLKAEYKYVERVLLILCLASLSYIVAVFTVKPDWAAIGQAIIRPQIELNGQFLITMLAVIGTTITPWAIYYLQASIADRGVDMKEYRYTRLDVSFGSAWGNVISAFILIVTAATLYVNGVAVNDAKDAAMALQPLAGDASSILFSVGLLGASLLAVSVLPLATTYAFCEAYGFERGLNRKVKEAPVFYGMLIAIMAISSLVVLIPNAPLFQMMILSQTLNAMLLPVLLILVLKLANSKEIMGKYTNSKLTNILAIGITLLIVVVTIALFFEPLLNKIF